MIKKLLLVSAVSLLIGISCTDLKEEPVGLLEPGSFFKTPADLRAAVNGSYAYMTSENYWGRRLPLTLLLMGDMCDIGDLSTALKRQEVNNFVAHDDNGMVTDIWPQSYAIIGAANQAIAGADLVSGEQETIDAIAAQAYFYRAFAYYHLVRLFGDIPYIDFAVSDISTVADISKTPADEVYTHIIADLQFAKDHLPNTQPTRSQPSKATAAAYLASVYLTIKDYQKSYTEAKYVIDNAGNFNLALEADFQDLFNADKAANLVEPLFTIDFIGLSNDGLLGTDYMASVTGMRADESEKSHGGGWTVSVPTEKVFDTWNERDYRRAVSFDTTAIFNGTVHPYTEFANFSPLGVNRAHIAKYYRYPGLCGSNARLSSNNYITMRYAEVLLIAAEAANEITGGSSEAVGYLNLIRQRARNRDGNVSNYPPDVTGSLSQSQLRDIIIEERRLELAFEFKRWYDIKRLKIGPQVFGSDGLEPHPNFSESRDYLLPLPGDELSRNPNLMPNNPGY